MSVLKRICIKTKQGRRLPCFYVNEIDSTNEFAKKGIKSGLVSDIAAFIAKTQTSGHGRYGRVFLSPKGGLYLTFVNKAVGEKDCSALGCYSALAVLDTLVQLGIEGRREVSLKWPNDVKINGKKVCGILPETVVINDVRYLLIGVGLNLNTPPESLKDLPSATSVFAQTNKKHRLRKVVKSLVQNLDEIVSAFLDGDKKDGYLVNSEMHSRYLEYCESIGLSVSYIENQEQYTGIVETVAVDGSLVMTDGKKIGWGEISYIE